MNKFEKLIEYIINDEDQKARELFHTIVVEKSRDIYESIMDEESVEENVHGQQVDDMVDEIHSEEAMEGEEEFGDDEMGGEEPAEFGDEDGEHEEHAEIEDQVMNIDAKLDELLAKFDEIMGDEGHSEEMPGEEPGMEHGEEGMMEAEEGSAMSGKSGKSGSAASGKSGSAKMEAAKAGSAVSGKSGKSGSAKSGKSGKGSAELMREYVDRIGDIYGGEGDAAEGTAVGAAGKKTSVNTKPGSVGPGADFGGTAVDFEGAEEAVDGKPINKPSNEYTKGEGKLIGKVGNTPGGDKKLKGEGHDYQNQHDGEGENVGAKDTMGKNINKKSEIGGRVR